MKHALPAALVGLTALVTGALVHAGYAIWWLSQTLFRGHAAPYAEAGARAVSCMATAIVLIAGLIGRRLATGYMPSAKAGAVPVRIVARDSRR